MEKENTHKNTIHSILAHSYFIFLFSIILGVIFDTFLKDKIFSQDIYKYVGFAMLVISSVIIIWSQKISRNYKKRIPKSEDMTHFEHGPYRFLRNPTHLSVFIMALGFGLIINSLFTIIFSVIAYLITKIFFLKKEEEILEKKYGEVYSGYKKKVKNWI
jgi:protein-S-isoprenylcysteine O-methyltransferase Ste14